MKFNLTYEITTLKGLEAGEADYLGFVTRNHTFPKNRKVVDNPHKFTLREAIEVLANIKGYDEPEPNCYPLSGMRWVTVSDWEGYEKDENLRVAIHFPDELSQSSKERIFNLIKNA